MARYDCRAPQEAARRCNCMDIISARGSHLKLERIPMRPPQASQIDTMPFSTGMLPVPSHCSHSSTASAVTRIYLGKR
jgi:hypothetical protein